MSFAPPVSRDGFHYNGDLYVEVGNLNRHKRASVAEITELLRPDLVKSKKTPGKDAFGHWYEAQLIHYGLPPSKDKARAKMRLLEALNASVLVVPPAIVKLEESLRKEYDVAERKAKALYKASMADSAGKPGSTKKRKQSDGKTSNATNVNINVNFGGFGGTSFGAGPDGEFLTELLTQQQESSPPKKAKTSATKAPAKKPVSSQSKNSPEKTDPKPKATPTKNTPIAKSLQTARKSTEGTKEPVGRPLQTARRSGGMGPQTARRGGGMGLQTARRGGGMSLQTARRSTEVTKEPVATNRQTAKRTPAVKKERAVKSEPAIKKEPGGHNQPALGLINGYYEISCPTLESEFDCGELSLILCLERPRVWGAYDFGAFSGILHLPQRPSQPSEDPLPCHWRGRENGEGEMSFGDNCFGEIAFLGDGRIAGMLNVYGDCEFTGMRRPGPTVAPRPANSMREEWEGYNEASYERERTGRWGGGW
ncbi:hypothetical protein MMC22_002556 [Lobaria immixta]|nr:hypothetical protein [Lobaria immixta]